MGEVRTVLIVGGGIGGLTAAIALAKRGIAAEIVEINPAWSVYGVGIIQPSNMLRALAQIDIGERCLAMGYGFPGWHICDANGNKLAEVPNENVAGSGYPSINGIARSAFHQILTETVLANGTLVRLGVTVSDLDEAQEGVNVRFTDGGGGVYDLVIAADGANSKMRERLFGTDLRARFTGESVWRYNFRRPREMRWGSLHYGARSKAGLVPLSDSLMYLFLVTSEPGNPRMPDSQLHLMLRERLQEYGGVVGGLRESITDPKGVVYRPMEVLLVPAPWHRGRVVLIGDAVHSGTPHLAQGAAMAIEDAVLLADILGEHGELQRALKAFADRRMPRCALVMDAGLKMGEWEMAEWAGQRAPDTDHGGLMQQALGELMKPI